MAIRELISVVQYNFPIAASTQLHAGMIVARDAVSGMVVAADRALHNRGLILGVLADDSSRTGNTIIQPDPVGSSYVDSLGVFHAYENALYPGAKRALGDWQAEDITNVTNLTAGASGYQGPMRGVGVYTSNNGIFATDQWNGVSPAGGLQTSDGATTWTDAAWSTAYGTSGQSVSGLTQGDLLTVGTGQNAGIFVKIVPASFYGDQDWYINGSAVAHNGSSPICARCDSYDSNSGLLYFTWLLG